MQQQLDVQSFDDENEVRDSITLDCSKDGLVIRLFEPRTVKGKHGKERQIYLVLCRNARDGSEYVRKYSCDQEGRIGLLSSDRLVAYSKSRGPGASVASKKSSFYHERVQEFSAGLIGNVSYKQTRDFSDTTSDESLDFDLPDFDILVGLSFTCSPFESDDKHPESPKHFLFQLASGNNCQNIKFIMKVLCCVREGTISLREFRSALAYGIYRDFSRRMSNGTIFKSVDAIVPRELLNYLILARELEGTEEVEYRPPYSDEDGGYIFVPALDD